VRVGVLRSRFRQTEESFVLNLAKLASNAQEAPDRRDLLLYLASTLRLSAAAASTAPDVTMLDIGTLLDCPMNMFDSRLAEVGEIRCLLSVSSAASIVCSF
jgi:hypothetical protein